VKDHVQTVVVHRRGCGLSAARAAEATEIWWLAQILNRDGGVGVDVADTGNEARFEHVDGVEIDAADEPDGVGRGRQTRRRADEKAALLLRGTSTRAWPPWPA
jgi:hypothetical protein